MSEHKLKKPGPTGKMAADGPLDENDEGELIIAIVEQGGKVRIDFGKKISWIAMTPDDAAEIATVIMKFASHLKAMQPGIITQ